MNGIQNKYLCGVQWKTSNVRTVAVTVTNKFDFRVEADGKQRLIVADWDFTELSRHQLRVEPLTGGTLRLTNLSSNVALRFSAGDALEASASRVFSMPITVYVSTSRFVTFQEAGPQSNPEPVLQSLATRPLAPGTRQAFSDSFADSFADPLASEFSPDGQEVSILFCDIRGFSRSRVNSARPWLLTKQDYERKTCP